MELDPPRFPTSTRWPGPAAKLAWLGALVLLLLLPVARLLDLVHERAGRLEGVRHEVAALWSGPQTLVGPVLLVPYRYVDGSGVARGGALRVLPEVLEWRGGLEPEVRRRGIFEVPVYRGRLQASGSFVHPLREDPWSWDVPREAVRWDRATLALGLSEVRGLEERIDLDWAGQRLAFEPGIEEAPELGAGIHAALPSLATQPPARLTFSFSVTLRGSERLHVTPLGKTTDLALSSPWPHPSFGGAFLPRQRRVGADGFAASWQVPYFGRSYPQRWRGDRTGDPELARQLDASSFGVELVRPADGYQRTERAVKYAVLFIGLTFGTCFLLELAGRRPLHPVQYLLVGFALCLFYLLLLALSEHLGFGPSYATAAAATILAVSLYVGAALAGLRAALTVGGTLAALDGYLYVLLQAEDYALLMGAVGLFVALALAMWLTRRVDWYGLRLPPSRVGTTPAS